MKNLANVVNIPNARLNKYIPLISIDGTKKYKPKIKASRINTPTECTNKRSTTSVAICIAIHAPLNIGAGKCLANQKYAHLATIVTSSKRLIISVKSHVPPILSLMDI